MQPRLRAPPHVTALAGDLGCCVPVHQAVMHGAAGEDYNVEHSGEGPRPFSAVLDTGLHRTSTGSKVFACLKVCAPPQGTRQGQTCWGRAQTGLSGTPPRLHAFACMRTTGRAGLALGRTGPHSGAVDALLRSNCSCTNVCACSLSKRPWQLSERSVPGGT